MISEIQSSHVLAIKNAYPTLDIHSTHLNAEGQFNDILFINEDLIFRFPRYEESIKDFLQETDILQKLQEQVNLPIPNPIFVNADGQAVGKVFMGYRMLAGKPLFRDGLYAINDTSILDILARQLATFLYGLHSLSPSALGLSLPVKNKLEEHKTFFSDIKKHLFPFMRPDARNSITEEFQKYFDDKTLHGFNPTLIHGDFGGSNILFDGNKITGIIDFSFAGLGDPATDIAAVSTFGDPFFRRICSYYPGIESLLERAKFYRGTFALQEALHGFRNNDKEAFDSGMEQYN